MEERDVSSFKLIMVRRKTGEKGGRNQENKKKGKKKKIRMKKIEKL